MGKEKNIIQISLYVFDALNQADQIFIDDFVCIWIMVYSILGMIADKGIWVRYCSSLKVHEIQPAVYLRSHSYALCEVTGGRAC